LSYGPEDVGKLARADAGVSRRVIFPAFGLRCVTAVTIGAVVSAESVSNSRPEESGASARAALWLLPLAVVAAWWVRDLSFEWSSLVEYRFGPIVVMLTAYLVWERWPTRPKPEAPVSFAPSLALASFGFVCVLAAELYRIGLARTPTSSMLLSIGCASFIAAQLLVLAGRPTLRHFLFPLLFFFIAVPIPKFFWNPIVLGLQSFVAMLNVETLRVMGIPAERHVHIIQLPNTQVGVDEACSGVRSLQSSIMAALFVGDLTLRRWGWKVFFVLGGVGLAIAGNFVRSLYLSLTAYRHGAEALKAVHDAAGWSVLAFTAVGVVLLALLVSRLDRGLPVPSAGKDS
jgi:exosortase